MADEPPPRDGVALLAENVRPDLDAGAAAGLGVMTEDAVPLPEATTCAPPADMSPFIAAAAAPLRDRSPRAPRADGLPPAPAPTVLRDAGCLAGDSDRDRERLDMASGGGPGDRSGLDGERGSSSILWPRLLPRQSAPRFAPGLSPAPVIRDILPLRPLLLLPVLVVLLTLPVLLLLLLLLEPPPPPLAPTEEEQIEEERMSVPRSIVKEPLQCASLSETEKLPLCRFAGAE